jgi:glucose/arabinose dehydrogenase
MRKRTVRTTGILTFAAAISLCAAAGFGNTPPRAPILIEPSGTRAIDPGDVHMATAPFNDDDAGDHLICSDWEIRTVDDQQIVWQSPCATGVLAVHIHLGDGTFTNAEGRLLASTHYVVRARFRDSSDDPGTEWSEWATQAFVTSAPAAIRPLEIVDILATPPPRFDQPSGAAAALPDGASVRVVSATGEMLVSFTGDGGSIDIANPPALSNHAVVKVIARSSASTLSLGETNLNFADETGVRHTIYLPALSLPPSTSIAFWIAADGSSFAAASESSADPLFAKISRGAATPWSVLEPGYRIERVASGLQLPVNIAFVPNPLPNTDAPLFYITELYGTIRAFLRDGTLRDYATGLLNFDPFGPFPGSGEQGIVGTAVDPESGDLFVATVYEWIRAGAHYPRVIRIHSEDGGRSAAKITTVFDMIGEDLGPSHQISSVSIGPDGKLYVHMGDGFQTQLARDLGSFRGKILRINKDGSPAADNPFHEATSSFIFASGFRNPFGGAWRAADASLYEVENGPDTDRLAKVSPGFDYGWSGDNDDMRIHAAYNWDESVAPVNIAFVQPETFQGSGFPAEKHDHAFVSESGPTYIEGTTPNGKRIREFAFDAAGNVTSTTPFVEYTGIGHATVAALAAGPDGLYFSDLYPDNGNPTDHGANIYRIRFVGQVSIGATVAENAVRTIQFSPAVTVPDYKSLQWDFGDGSTSADLEPQHTFPGNGPYDVTLRITTAQGTIVDDYKRVQFPETPGVGLAAIYRDANGIRTERLDPKIDFDWRTDAPAPVAEFIDVLWTGAITPAISGVYTFYLHTSGNAILRIDGHTLIDTYGDSPISLVPIRLEAGHRYLFTLQTADNPLDGTTQLSWSSGGMSPHIVPSSVLYPPVERRRAVRP